MGPGMAESVDQGVGEETLGVEQVRGWAGFRLDGIGGSDIGKVAGAFACVVRAP
jgi:hypothetical protein